ncbi:MAG: apolipoprotein N-acyltransferase [Roseovarius sp.]
MTQTAPLAPAERLALRLAAGRRLWLILIAVGLGMFAALGQAPVGAWPLSVIALGCWFGLLHAAPSAKRAALISWAGGTGYFLLALSWIVEPFLVDIARHGWMAPFALTFMAGGLALFWGLAGWLTHRAGNTVVAFVTTLTLVEALRGWIFTGFPWAQPGHIWIDTSLLGLAAYTGALGLTLVTLILAVLIWRALGGNKLMLAAALMAQAAILLGTTAPGPLQSDAPIVRLIQPNAPQHEKWDPAKMPIFFNRQLEFTRAMTRSGGRPDLIVWPETSIPSVLNYADDVLAAVAQAADGASVVLGAQRFGGVRLYNSLVVLDGQGAQTHLYDKHHLVPFGEYFPFGHLAKHVGLQGLAAEDGDGYSSGPGPQMLDLGPLGKALPLICYEGVFPRHVAATSERADFILLITNDAWFGQVSGPYQHLAQARLRSAEQGLPMIRVANTGVSAMIDAHGQIVSLLPLGKSGYADKALPAALPPTLYSKTGDLPLLAFVALILGGAFITRKRQTRLSD